MVTRKKRKTIFNGLPPIDTSGIPKINDFRGKNKIIFNLERRHSPVVCKISPEFDLYMKKIQIEEMKKNNLLLSKAQISDLILGKLREQESIINSKKDKLRLF